MTARWVLLWFCLLACVAEAAVTVAWKIPMESVAPDFKTSGACKRLEKAPGSSAFIQAGDELWDISKAKSWPRGFKFPVKIGDPKEEGPFGGREGAWPTKPWSWNGEADPKWEGEWVVWNARSGMIVARGSWEDVRRIEAALDLYQRPEILRTKLELVEGGKPARLLSIVSRSGEDKEASVKAEGTEARVAATVSSDLWVEARLSASWPAGEGGKERWDLATTLSMQSGQRLPVAAHGEGKARSELFVTVVREWLDGTPVSQERWIEEQGTAVPWISPKFQERVNFTASVGEGRKVFMTQLPPVLGDMMHVAELPVPRAVDVPEVARECLRGSVLDFRPYLAAIENCPALEQGDFAGFDPVSQHLLVIASPAAAEKFDDFFGCLYDPPLPGLWIETNREAGAWGLTLRSGEKCSLEKRKGKRPVQTFTIEASGGHYQAPVELEYKMNIGPGGEGLLEAKTILPLDVFQEIGSFALPGGEEKKVVVKVKENVP